MKSDFHSQRDILKAALMTPGRHGWGAVTYFVGDPGTGKTTSAEAVAKDLGMVCFPFIGSQIDPPDLVGWPKPRMIHGVECLDFIPAAWVVEANHIAANTDAGVVVCLDEFSSVHGTVQAAFLSIVSERRVGRVKLHPRVRIILFANPEDVAQDAGGAPLAPAMAARVTHGRWSGPAAQDAVPYLHVQARGGEYHASNANTAKLEASVMARWEKEFSTAAAQVATFLTKNPQHLHKLPETSEARRGAYPTARGWEDAARALAGARIHGLDKTQTLQFAGGYVGLPLFQQVLVHADHHDIPDAKDWLDGVIELDANPARADVTSTVLRAGVAVLEASNDDDFLRRLGAMIGWYNAHFQGMSDVCAGPVREMFAAWKKRCERSTSMGVTILRTHGPAVARLRGIPALKRLTEHGLFERGTV